MKNRLLLILAFATSLAQAQLNVSDVYYCGPGSANFTTTDPGCTDYEWYDESGQQVGTGCDFTSNITAFDKTYTVSDPSNTNTNIFGYDFTSPDLSDWENGPSAATSDATAKYTTNFQVYTPITFNSLDIQYEGLPSDPGGNIMAISVLNNTGGLVYTFIPALIHDGGIHTLTVPMNAPLTPGSYKLQLHDIGGTPFVDADMVFVHDDGGDFDDGGAMDYEQIRINRTDQEGDNDDKIHNGTGGAYNWNLTYDTNIQVLASDTCAANACITVGQPLAFIDFGNGSANAGPALSNNSTTYSFNSLNTPSGTIDGQYTIVNSAFEAAGSTIGGWHDGEDHTPGDNNGYMLMVNADIQPGEFYRTQVNDLCENTFYVFSAYLANLLQPSACGGSGIAPDVTFRIEDLNGNILMNETTGNIPFSNDLTWLEYNFRFFLTQGASSVNLVLINNAPGGCGNDIVIDDIAFRPCGPDLQITSSTPMPACVGSDVHLQGLIPTELQTADLQWQISNDSGATFFNIPGATNSDYFLPALIDGEQYRLSAVITDGSVGSSCPVISNTLTISTMSNTTHIPEQDPLCIDDSRDISVSDNGGSYNWSVLASTGTISINSTDNNTVNITGVTAGSISLMVEETLNGCSDFDTTKFIINALPNVSLIIPDSVCTSDTNIFVLASPEGGTLSGNGITGLVFNPASNDVDPNVLNPLSYSYTDENECTNQVTKNIKIIEVPDLSISIDRTLMCAGEFTTLHYHSQNLNNDFDWFQNNVLFSSNLTDVDVFDEGNFHAEAELNGCTAKSNTVSLAVSTIEIELEEQYIITEGESLLLSPEYTLTPVVNFDSDWLGLEDGSSYTGSTITVAPILDNQYFVIATNEVGCSDSAQTLVIVKHPIRVPEIISPNGDGLNDEWIIKNIFEYPEAVIKVYNRWGNVVFKSFDGYENDWQGTFSGEPLPVATYYYVIELPTVNESHAGSLTIIK